jgi:hypothetical protein
MPVAEVLPIISEVVKAVETKLISPTITPYNNAVA